MCIVILYSLVIFRMECVLKKRRVKDDIVDLAKSINKESQEVTRIAGRTAEACTDRIMKNVSHGRILLTLWQDSNYINEPFCRR